MKKKYTKYPSSYIKANSTVSSYDLDKVYSIEDVFPWLDTDYWYEQHPNGATEEEMIYTMEDNGITVPSPLTLRAACEAIWNDSTHDIDQILRELDYAHGNGVGIAPLTTNFSWGDQFDIFIQWYRENVDPNYVDVADSDDVEYDDGGLFDRYDYVKDSLPDIYNVTRRFLARGDNRELFQILSDKSTSSKDIADVYQAIKRTQDPRFTQLLKHLPYNPNTPEDILIDLAKNVDAFDSQEIPGMIYIHIRGALKDAANRNLLPASVLPYVNSL